MSEQHRPIGGTPEGHNFPDLTVIGRAFTESITYINAQSHTNLQPEARSWLISFARKTMWELQIELNNLRANKDSPTLLPRYAFDPNCELILFSDNIPFKLHQFAGQFVSYTTQLLKACGLDASVGFVCAVSMPAIRIRIKFSHTVKSAQEGTSAEIMEFDCDFEKEFFGAVNDLRIEG